MSAPKPISLGFTSNPGRTPAAGAAMLVNCYAEVTGAEQMASTQVWASDGLTVWSTSPDTTGTRAMINVDGTLYKVRGRRIYRVDASGIESDIGGIASDSPVTMARNRRPSPQIGIVSQDGQYVVIEAGIATDYTSILRGGANSICSVAGYFVFTHQDGSVSHTQEDNATSVDLLAYGLAESSADPAIRALPKQGEVVALGTKSIDYFANVGGDPFAFQRNQSVSIGCAAAGSCAEVDQTIMFLASDLTVRIIDGYQAVRVSNHAIERAIALEADIAGIVSMTWVRDGHTFYCISGSSFSYVYNLTTRFWHARQSYNSTRWLASCAADFDGNLIVGAYNSGALYKMERDAHGEGDNDMVCKIIMPPVHAFPSRVKIAALYVNIIPGVGRNTYAPPTPTVGDLYWGADLLTWGAAGLMWGDGTIMDEGVGDYASYEPELVMRSSLDGGNTWTAERRAKLGRMGDGLSRVVFRRIGATRQYGITFELSCSAKVMRGFMGAAIDVEKLAA